MGENITKELEDKAPCITKVIGGRQYRVVLHFKEDSKETAQDKMKRVLVNTALNQR